MAVFKFKAKDSYGKMVHDSVQAETQREAIGLIRARGLKVVYLERAKVKVTKKRKSGKVKLDDVATLARQLSTMVDAGLALIDALRVLYEQTESSVLQTVLGEVISSLEGGMSFTDSIAKFPNVFDSFFVNMVKAGEASGNLPEVLLRVADQLEATSALRHKVKMAMIYPAIVSCMAILITTVLLIKVIPAFKDIFDDFKAELPLPTKLLIAFSEWFQNWFILIVVIIVIAIILLVKYKKTERGRRRYDRIKLKFPVFGNLFKMVALTKFTKTLGTLVKSGVPIIESMNIVKEISGNKVIEDAVIEVEQKIKEGQSIEGPLYKSDVFPPMVVKMVGVGEKSGKLDLMLEKVADYYSERVEDMVAGLSSLIEPLLIAFLGIVVGSIMFAMFLPLFRLSAIAGS